MPPLKKKSLELEERRLKVAANILAGLNYRDIAKGLNVSLGTVARDAQIVITRMRKEQVNTMSEAALIDLRRIDVALNAIFDDVKEGKLLAIDRLLTLLKRRAEMIGYDEQVFKVNLVGSLDINDLRDKRWTEIAPMLGEVLSELNGVTESQPIEADEETEHDTEN